MPELTQQRQVDIYKLETSQTPRLCFKNKNKIVINLKIHLTYIQSEQYEIHQRDGFVGEILQLPGTMSQLIFACLFKQGTDS